MQGSILVIEDETDLGNLIKMYLENEGFSVNWVVSAEDGLAALPENSFDLIILDINLPGMDGFEFLQEIRGKYNLPVIISSARESDEDIILGLGCGADEFVMKPFSPKVLVARVRAFLRRIKRSSEVNNSEKCVSIKDVKIYPESYLLTKNNQKVILSAREFEVLLFLAEKNGKACSMEQIYESVWGNQYGDISAVAVYVQRLRKKIEDNPVDPQIIQTIHGKGYRLNFR